MNATFPHLTPAADDINQRFYDQLWSDARLVPPERFNTWPLVQALAAGASRRLEVGPGLRPRLPIHGTDFVDISEPALAKLRAAGGNTRPGVITRLPFADGAYDLVCALDIVEHVDDDDAALAELSRVAAPGAAVLLSMPLHPELWTLFDELVGHRRRYRAELLARMLASHGLDVGQSAVFGMKPKHPRLVELGMRLLERRRRSAMWWYNHVIMPLGVRTQKPLRLHAGLMDTRDVAEVLLVCRKRAG